MTRSLGRIRELRVSLDGGADDEGVGVVQFGCETMFNLVGVTICQPGSCWKTARVAGETFSARTIFKGDPRMLGDG